jgi:hypothetical protein
MEERRAYGRDYYRKKCQERESLPDSTPLMSQETITPKTRSRLVIVE